MLKHLILLIISASLAVNIAGCTSSDSEPEESSADVEMVDAIDEAAQEGTAAEGEDPFASDFSGGDEATADLGASDLPPEGGASDDPFADTMGGDDPFADSAGGGGDLSFDDTAGDDFAFDEGGTGGDDFGFDEGGGDTAGGAGDVPMEEAFAAEPPAEEMAAGGMGMGPSDTFSEPMADTPMDEPIAMGDGSDVMEDSFQETPEPSWVPIKKIADQPFRKNGVLINAVYIARPGDTMQSISQKIYGNDRAEELYTANPSFRTSSLDTGEKVYYNSPNRPNDDSMLKTFYEDVGLAPETYISQEGDNIRGVSKQLLGDQNSWKEVWATNPDVESKGELAAGTSLRYWANSDVAGTTPPPMAANEPPPPSEDEAMADEPPPMPDMAANEPPPPPEPPAEDIPPPPPAPDLAQNEPPPPPPPPSAGSLEPPPPPSAGSIEPPPPPPPPPSMAKKRAKSAGFNDTMGAAAQEEQVMMIAIGAALVFVALILFIIIRKKKARRQIDFNTATQTQIE